MRADEKLTAFMGLESTIRAAERPEDCGGREIKFANCLRSDRSRALCPECSGRSGPVKDSSVVGDIGHGSLVSTVRPSTTSASTTIRPHFTTSRPATTRRLSSTRPITRCLLLGSPPELGGTLRQVSARRSARALWMRSSLACRQVTQGLRSQRRTHIRTRLCLAT